MIDMDSAASSFAHAITHHGWAITTPVLAPREVAALRDELAPLAIEGRGGARNLLDLEAVRALAVHPKVRRLAVAVLGDVCFAVRALFFDKTPSANWKVIWHQDLTIATSTRAEVSGFGPWTEKGGVPHVQPSMATLEDMLAVRVHLDPSGPDNGPVRVLDATHTRGRLSGEAIDALRAQLPAQDCLVEEGGVLAFRPLLLHASAPAVVPHHRRVVHIEYAARELPSPLVWHRAVA